MSAALPYAYLCTEERAKFERLFAGVHAIAEAQWVRHLGDLWHGYPRNSLLREKRRQRRAQKKRRGW